MWDGQLKKRKKKVYIGTSPMVEWLRLHLPMQGSRVQSLAGELRSYMPCSVAKTKKKMYVDYSSAVLRGEYWLCNLIVSDKVILSDVSNGADVLIREAQHTV